MREQFLLKVSNYSYFLMMFFLPLSLVLDNIFLGIMFLSLVFSLKELSKSIFILLIATVLVQVATTVFAQITNDPLEAGLPFVIITIPLSIILLIFVIKELRSKT